MVARSSLAALLDRDPKEWRSSLDRRYSVLDEVLEGRRRAIVYPAARMGREAAGRLRSAGVDVVAFGDRDPTLHGGQLDGLPVLSPAQVAATHDSAAILVSSTLFDSAIREDLNARGCKYVVPVGYLNLRLPEVFGVREYDGAWNAVADPANRADIEAGYSLMGDDTSRRVFEGKLAYYLSLDKARLDDVKSREAIYFDPSVYDLGVDEIVVDGGAYIGDTLSSFLEHSSGRFLSYVAFEPDAASFTRLSTVAERDPLRITTVCAGLGRRTSKGRLSATRGPDSRLLDDHEAGGEEVHVVGLDDFFEGHPSPTLIKMDIEGAEVDALNGAARLLEVASPTLAISAYHFPADLWNIPLLLHRLMPGSRLHLRHYTREVDDTVCYAIPARRPNKTPSQAPRALEA